MHVISALRRLLYFVEPQKLMQLAGFTGMKNADCSLRSSDFLLLLLAICVIALQNGYALLLVRPMKFVPFIAVFALASCATVLGQQMPVAPNTVNVTITKQRKVLVEAHVNGVSGNFLIDTGAGNSYIGERFADSLHAPRNEGGSSYSVMGQMRFDVIDIENLELGRNRIPVRHELIHVSNLGWINKSRPNLGNAIHGIIGADILINNQAVIDCAQSRIRFGYTGTRTAEASKFTVNFISRIGDELAVVARVNGVAGTFIVDTGYNVSLVSPEFAYRLNTMGRSASKSHLISVTSMQLGINSIPIRQDQMVVTSRVSIVNQGYMALGESPYDGVLGMDFLLNHHAIIDCRQKQLHID